MNRLLRLIRLITLVLCTTVLTVMLFSGAPAYAEAFVGMISGRTETGFTLHTEGKTLNTVITKDTVWDVSDAPENGDVVTVLSDKPVYHGLLYAQTVTCHTLHGVISRVVDGEEPYLLLLPEKGVDEIRVNLPAINPSGMAAGITVKVYYNGMQTRSIPPQITALYLRGAALRGTVTEVMENSVIRLQKEDGETVLLHPTDETIVLTAPEAGKQVEVSVLPAMRLSLPAQYEIQDILPINEQKERDPSCGA